MWKCKKCGGTEFRAKIIGSVRVSCPRTKGEGCNIYYTSTLQITDPNQETIFCCKCKNENREIKKIAKWEK